MIDERERFERAFEQFSMPEPSWDRLLRRRDRKRRNQRIAAGVVGIAVFAAAVWGIWLAVREGAFHQTPRPAAPAPPVRTPSTAGIIGLPPEGATPSTPDRGELVLASWAGTTSGPRTWMWVYADGRVIRRQEAVTPVPYGDGNHFTVFIEQRLTPAGVELLRSEVISSELFEKNQELTVDANIGYSAFIEVRRGDRFVRVSYTGRTVGTLTSPAPQPATQAQGRALLGLDAKLGDPASWLPATAWEDRTIRPYVPSMYAICYSGGPPGPGNAAGAAQILDALPKAAADLLRTKDRTTEVGDHCSQVSSAEARRLAEAFDEAGYPRTQRTAALSYVVKVPGPLEEIFIGFDPILPHGEATRTAGG
jgi:hypothetical protein